MAVYKNYVNKFYSQRGNRWDLEIWSRSDSSLDSVEFSTGKGGFRLSYKGGDDRQDIIMPSEVTIPFIVKNADDQAFINGFLTADDKEYLLVIRRNFVIFWFGNLNAGFDSKQNDYYPYITTLKANDFLGEMMNDKAFTNVVLQSQTQTPISTHTTGFYNNIADLGFWDNDIFPFGNAEKVIKTNFRWTAPNMFSYADNVSKINQFVINPLGFANDSNYIHKYKLSDTSKEVLKAFGLKMFMADGKMYLLQPYNYVQNSVKFQNYTNSSTAALLPIANEQIFNFQNADNDLDSETTPASGFQLNEWILEPADFTDSIWQANGSCTQITSNSFNIAVTSSYLYIDLVEGEYCLSYSQNDASVYISLEIPGGSQTLLDESGHTNFSVGSGGAELRVRSSVADTLSVEHIGLQKGSFTHRSFLAGTSFRYDRPISTVTAKFPFGQSVAQAISNFPNTDDTNTTESIYTSLTSIGALSTSASELLQVNFNVFYGERFDYLSGTDLWTHIGGSIELKLKIGSLYLNGVPGNFSWSSSDSTFTLNVPITQIADGTAGMFWSQTMEPECQSFVANLGNNYYFGPSSAGSTGFVGVNYATTLPTLTAGGDVSLQFVNGTINYYINPDTSNPNVAPTPLSPIKNNHQTKWFTGSPFSYATPGVPQLFNITSGIEQNQQTGIEFSASTGLNNYKSVDLGNIKLGISGDETTHINCIRIANSSFIYEMPNYLQVDNTGTQYNMTRLLLEQYLEPQIEPLEIIQGDYYVNDFSAFKSIILYGKDKYVFFEGTLNAEDDVVNGSWYKIAESSETITTDEEDIIYEEDDTPPAPPPPNPHDPVDPYHITNSITKGKDWVKYNSIGLTNVAITATATTRVDLINTSRSKLYSGQKLILTKPDLSNPIIITKSGDSNVTTGRIDVSSFTPSVTYPAGSILTIAEYDLTNVIGNLPPATPTSPGGSNTQVQFNDNGSFGGTDLITIGSDKVTFTGNVEILGSNEKITLNSGGDIVIDNDVNGGSGSGGLLYRDSGGGLKFAFVVHPSNIVTICNRAANGEVQIRANTSTAGASGELTIATFKDTSVDFLNAAELRGTNIGNIFDLEAYLTAVDFCMTDDRAKAGHTTTNGASSKIDNSTASSFATFQVPLGYRATHVQVNGSSSSSTFDVYECSVTNATATALTSSPAVNTNQSLSSQHTGGVGKYISIKFTPGDRTRTVYGAKITLERV